MEADDELPRGREVVAEGRVRGLGLAQHPLVAEGERGEILQPLRHLLVRPQSGEEGRALHHVGPLGAPALLPQRVEVVRRGRAVVDVAQTEYPLHASIDALAFAWIGDGLRLVVDPRKRVV